MTPGLLVLCDTTVNEAVICWLLASAIQYLVSSPHKLRVIDSGMASGTLKGGFSETHGRKWNTVRMTVQESLPDMPWYPLM